MEENIKRVIDITERKLKHAKNRVSKYKDHHADTHTFHGGYSKGYWESRVTAYEIMLDDVLPMLTNTKEN